MTPCRFNKVFLLGHLSHFITKSLRPFAILISIVHAGVVAGAVKRLAQGAMPKCTLQSIHLIRQRSLKDTWGPDVFPFTPHVAPPAMANSSIKKFFTLNIQQTGTASPAFH